MYSDILSWYFPAVVNEQARLRLPFIIGLEILDSSICLRSQVLNIFLGLRRDLQHCITCALAFIMAYDPIQSYYLRTHLWITALIQSALSMPFDR